MNVTPEVAIRHETEGQVGWFKTQPIIEPMPPLKIVKKWGLIVEYTPEVMHHPNFVPMCHE